MRGYTTSLQSDAAVVALAAFAEYCRAAQEVGYGLDENGHVIAKNLETGLDMNVRITAWAEPEELQDGTWFVPEMILDWGGLPTRPLIGQVVEDIPDELRKTPPIVV